MIWDILSSPRAVLAIAAIWFFAGVILAFVIGRIIKRLGDD